MDQYDRRRNRGERGKSADMAYAFDDMATEHATQCETEIIGGTEKPDLKWIESQNACFDRYQCPLKPVPRNEDGNGQQQRCNGGK